jgi:hypothetical protein
MQLSTLLLPAAFAANRRPLPPPPLLTLPPSRHHCHHYHHGRTHRCPLSKKEATAAPPQHTNGSTNMKLFTSPDNMDLFNLSTVFEVGDVS